MQDVYLVIVVIVYLKLSLKSSNAKYCNESFNIKVEPCILNLVMICTKLVASIITI